MGEPEPVTETMDVAQVRERWSPVIDAVARGRTRVVIERAGIPVAALVSAADLRRLRRNDAERAADFAVLDRIGAAFADVPYDELEREVAKANAEARAELRAEREQAERSP